MGPAAGSMNTGTWQAIASLGERPGRSRRTGLRSPTARRPNVDGFRPVRSKDASTRDSKCFVSVSMAPTGRDPACEDPLMHCGAWPSSTGCRLGGCFQRVEGRPTDRGEGLHRAVRGHRCRQGGQCGRPRLEADATGEP